MKTQAKRDESRQRIRVGSLDVDDISLSEAVDHLFFLSEQNAGGYCVLANAHMGYLAQEDSDFRTVVQGSSLVFADGRPVYWAGRLLGAKRLEHCRGENVFNRLIEESVKRGLTVGFLGCRDTAGMQALTNRVCQMHPGISIGYQHVPPFFAVGEITLNPTINSAINASGVSLLFVGLGCPKQELWMAASKAQLTCVSVGVGAVFDFIGGEKATAPRLFQVVGIEWLFRLITEPRRLFRRYFIESFSYVFQVVKQLIVKA